MHTTSSDDSPVFIVGMNGSGTTMLLDCLGRHPQLYGFPLETRVMPSFLSSDSRYGDLKNDDNFLELFHTIRKLPVFQMVNQATEIPLPDNWRDYSRQASAVFDYIFLYFAGLQGKTRWCEKTPQHVQHMDLLAQNYPQAKFVHIIRDGRDCASSFQRRWYRTPELTIYRWRKVVDIGRQQGIRLADRYMEVKYEDITTAPEVWMKKICEFIGVDFDKNVLVSRRPQSENRGVLGGIEKNTEKWRTSLSIKCRRSLERIAGQSLSQLGYPVEFEKGNFTPSKNQLRIWNIKDYTRQFFVEIYKKLTGKSKKDWRMLLYLPVSAIKQSRSNRY